MPGIVLVAQAQGVRAQDVIFSVCGSDIAVKIR